MDVSVRGRARGKLLLVNRCVGEVHPPRLASLAIAGEDARGGLPRVREEQFAACGIEVGQKIAHRGGRCDAVHEGDHVATLQEDASERGDELARVRRRSSQTVATVASQLRCRDHASREEPGAYGRLRLQARLGKAQVTLDGLDTTKTFGVMRPIHSDWRRDAAAKLARQESSKK